MSEPNYCGAIIGMGPGVRGVCICRRTPGHEGEHRLEPDAPVSEINHGPLPDGGFWAGFCSNPDCSVLGCPGDCQDPPETQPVAPAPDVAAMAKELHTLLRNGKEFPYSDGEEKRHYELVVTRWLEKPQPVVPAPDAAAVRVEVLAGLVEEMNAKHDEYDNGDHIKDYYVACGITIARALVESALWSIRGPET